MEAWKKVRENLLNKSNLILMRLKSTLPHANPFNFFSQHPFPYTNSVFFFSLFSRFAGCLCIMYVFSGQKRVKKSVLIKNYLLDLSWHQ